MALSQEHAQQCSAPYRECAGPPGTPTTLLLERGDYQMAGRGVGVITLVCNKSAWRNKLRQDSVLTLQAAGSFIVTAWR